MWRKTYAELVAYCGGEPNVAQAALIPHICGVILRAALLEHVAEDRLSERDSREYLATVNTIARLMKELGPDQREGQRKGARGKSLAEHLAEASS